MKITFIFSCSGMFARKLVFFWHQSEARTATTVWNWSGKTLFPGALLAVLYFSSFHIYFSARLDFPSPPLSAPGSPRMKCNKTGADWNNIFKGKYNNAKCNRIEITWTNTILSNMLQRSAALKTLS